MFRFVLLVLLVALTGITSVRAQPVSPAEPAPAETVGDSIASAAGAVIVVRQINHARAALETAGALRTREHFADAPIEVVVCGGGSRSLLQTSADAASLFAEANRLNVRLLACGMSLGRLGIAPAELAAGIEVVPNGLLHALERQVDGFVSVEL